MAPQIVLWFSVEEEVAAPNPENIFPVNKCGPKGKNVQSLLSASHLYLCVFTFQHFAIFFVTLLDFCYYLMYFRVHAITTKQYDNHSMMAELSLQDMLMSYTSSLKYTVLALKK